MTRTIRGLRAAEPGVMRVISRGKPRRPRAAGSGEGHSQTTDASGEPQFSRRDFVQVPGLLRVTYPGRAGLPIPPGMEHCRGAVGVDARVRTDTEGVGEAGEEGKQTGVVDGLGNLGVAPPGIPEALDLGIGYAVGVEGHRGDELEEQAFGRRHRRGLQIGVA